MLRMDQVHVIRHKVLVEEQSIRRVAREMGVSHNTVRKYLQVGEPARQESGPRKRPVLEAVAARIDQLLEEWKPRTTPKQRGDGDADPPAVGGEGTPGRSDDGPQLPVGETPREGRGLRPAGSERSGSSPFTGKSISFLPNST